MQPPAKLPDEAGLQNADAVPRLSLLASLRGYRLAWLRSDLSAGLAIAAVGVPSAIAYPAIAGLPAETGVYASIASVIGYALFGPSRRLVVGPDAATIAVLAAVLATVLSGLPSVSPQDRAAAAAVIALGVGGICILSSALRLGNLASLLSRPILVGFFVGVAISILVGQIGRITGLSISAEGLVSPLLELAMRAGSVHWPSFLLAVAMFAILQADRMIGFLIPGQVIVVVLSIALSLALDFQGMGIETVGTLPGGLPAFRLPWVAGLPLIDLLQGCAAVFIVSFGAGIITARSFAVRTGEAVNANAELAGFGAANIASGVLGGFPVTSSDSRTTVNLSVGGRTQIAGLASALILAGALLFLGDLLRVLPIPALGAILIAAALSVIDLDQLRQIWRISRIEFVFALIAMAGAISFGVLQGVVVAIIATFVHVILEAMQPRVVLLGRLPGRLGFYKLHRSAQIRPVDGMTICFVQGGLLFFNSDHVKARLTEIIKDLPPQTRWFIVDAAAITQMDSTAVQMLQDVHAELRRRGIRLGFSQVQSDVATIFGRAGLAADVGPDMFFDDLEDALAAFESAPPGDFPAQA